MSNYAWGIYCCWIDQASGPADGFFIPFGLENEWTQFRNFVPSGLTVSGCVVPASVSGLPATSDIMTNSPRTLSSNYTACNSYNTNTPQLYGRPAVSRWPASPQTIGAIGANTLTCNNGNTTMMAQVQWTAIDEETDPLLSKTLNVIPGEWTWEREFKYSPDVDLSATVASFTQVTINWNIAPHINGTGTLSNCTLTSSPYTPLWTTGAPLTPNSAGEPRSGSKVMNLSSNQNYSFSLRCDENSNGTALASIASASVATGWGGGCSEGCGTGGGGWG